MLDCLDQTLDGTDVVLVDDGSSDSRIAPLLHGYKTRHPDTQIITHGANLGFVAAVNSGLSAAPGNHHVILLNTDTLPPKAWVPRLMAPIARDPTIASVTPMSNNAEILSVPYPRIETAPTPDMVCAIDSVAQTLNPRLISIPTGIGFCMALNRAFIDRIGAFDPAFGRGYGEEVDWCRRAIAAGGRHVVQPKLFVGHRGGASFGASEKTRRIHAATRMISDRYPDYDGAVQKWIRDCPIAPERLALALAWLNSVNAEPVTVFLAHSLGGGAETGLREDILTQLKRQPGVVVLRVGGPRAWRIEVHGPGFRLAGDVANDALFRQMLTSLPRRRVIYSCAVGARDPASLPHHLLDLATDGLELRLHDFFPISPSWNLLDSRGQFAGVPPADTDDPAHQIKPSKCGKGLCHSEWRALWGQVIDRANHIRAYAPSGAALLQTAYPQSIGKIGIEPHALTGLPPPLPAGGQSIGILGGINRAKGGAVLEQLAKVTSRRIVIIGEMDRQFRLPRPHVVHGRYDKARIADLARSYDIGLWLIPSICPETFSFATHEALATGLPVLSFDLGAQADALRPARNGHVLTSGPSDVAALSAVIEKALHSP